MRKFLAALMVVFMLAATLAALPISAEEAAPTVSVKDGSTAADAAAIDLVITEVAANTKSTAPGSNNYAGDAFQYIEIYNRGETAVDLADYAIVQAEYKSNSDTPWANNENRVFEKKIPIINGSIFDAFPEAEVTSTYKKNCGTNDCINKETELEPGQVAIVWFWNAATNAAAGRDKSLSAHDDVQGDFYKFRAYYKNTYKNSKGEGVEIPADALIVAVYGTDEIDASFQLNTTGNKMYGLVKNTGEGFILEEEPIATTDDGKNYTRNEKVVCMWELGKGLGYTDAYENTTVIYTTADNTPVYYNAKNEKNFADYVAISNNKCEGFKELAAIWYKEDATPGTLLPIQWADLDPDQAPVSVKGSDENWTTTVWTTYAEALLAATKGTEVESRPEEDKEQDKIDVNRGNLGNLGQNSLGAWVYFYQTDAAGVTKYYRYQNDGQHSEEDAVEISKEEYDIAIAAIAEAEKGEGLGIVLWIIIGGGAAVVLGAGAVVLILILKKKNKNVATDDVAGDVQIIDEDGATIAVEEAAPVAEEPVAEETTEE